MCTNAAFYAVLTKAQSLEDNAIIKFDGVRTNIGEGYHWDSGLFRAPLSGCYVFNVSLVTNPEKVCEVQLMKNGEQWMKLYAGCLKYFGTGTNMAVMQLAKGDEVWIQAHGKLYSKGVVLDGSLFCSFSGFLQS